MDRLEAFEKMLADMQQQAEKEHVEMEKMKAAGKEKTAAYRQYFSNHLFYQMIFRKYREYVLIQLFL